jgi:uncharacterized protein YqeY
MSLPAAHHNPDNKNRLVQTARTCYTDFNVNQPAYRPRPILAGFLLRYTPGEMQGEIMSKKTELETALKEAMKAQDDLRKRVIRMALASIKNQEIDKGAAVDDAGVLAVVQKEIKSRQESIADARKAGRADLQAAYLDEIHVLEGFLPRQLTQPELEDLARQAIAETGAKSIKEMGLVMKALLPRLEGRAGNDAASAAVRRLLQ